MKKELVTFYVSGDAAFKRRVKAEAAARGVDMADLIRQAIDSFFAPDARQNGRTSAGSVRPLRYKSIRE